ncbi:MAG: PepSY-associated TM helix domain-containing protein [Pseudomonadota bacterium]
MTWLHTWLGVTASLLLFTIFLMGSLSVFDKEIDKWMKPELRYHLPAGVSLDERALPKLNDLDVMPGGDVWVELPSARYPVIRLSYEEEPNHWHDYLIDPRTGGEFTITDSWAGTGFFFPFHHMLHMPGGVGRWLVAFLALSMLTLTLSGIFVHRHFLRDFFTFRLSPSPHRSFRDLHTVTAVAALPFYLFIGLTGIMIVVSTYFSWSMNLAAGGDSASLDRQFRGTDNFRVEASGTVGHSIESLDEFVARAEGLWRAQNARAPVNAGRIGILNFNDVNARVVVAQYFPAQRVTKGPYIVAFDSASGEMLGHFEPSTIRQAWNFLEGLHWIQFDNWGLRWLYFFVGLIGTVMIACGLLFWIEKRLTHMVNGNKPRRGVRFMRALTNGMLAGMLVATCAYLVLNRVLPDEFTAMEQRRADWEIMGFFPVLWICIFYATFRGAVAWRDLSWVIAVLASAAVFLNWITTGHHLVATVAGGLWSIAAIDLLLLACSGLAATAAIILGGRHSASTVMHSAGSS